MVHNSITIILFMIAGVKVCRENSIKLERAEAGKEEAGNRNMRIAQGAAALIP